MTEKLGILGGTFHPVHRAHVEMATLALSEMGLCAVWLMPDGMPPHKSVGTVTARQRLEMARLAVEGIAHVEVDGREIERGGYTYTVDTLRGLRAQMPDRALVMIVGSDTLLELRNWKDFDAVAKLCTFFVVRRKSVPNGEAERCAAELAAEFGARITLSEREVQAISSTLVRNLIASGGDWEALVPPKVADYIRQNGLYLNPQTSLFDRLSDDIRDRLPLKRWRHTLGVIQTAELYAKRFGGDVEKARLAALLHDCAKPYRGADALELMRKYGVTLDADTARIPELWHGPLAAAIAEHEYGVADPEILNAVARHTVGSAQMTLLDKIIKLADLTEPGRTYAGVDRIRNLAEQDLDGALLMAMRDMSRYVGTLKGTVHPGSLRAIEALEKAVREKEREKGRGKEREGTL